VTRRRTLVPLLMVAVTAGLIANVPAMAITGGGPDTTHTNVGLVRFTTADGRFRCSGTLIAPKVVLTAGHCTEGPATNVYVSFDDALQPDPLQPGISDAEKAAREAHYITGTAYPDPSWDGKLSFPKQHDQGVVVLAARATTKWPDIVPAPLPPVGYLDRNQGQLKNATFTLVGYGIDIGDKKSQVVLQARNSTTSYLKNVGTEVVSFQINDNDAKAGGGSCFGDSGGAVFLNGYVLGDASYVNSLTCNATGTYQRDDTTYSRAFLNNWLAP
jgi:Trypsin